MDSKSNKIVWLAVAIGAAYGLIYPFFSDVVGLQDPKNITIILAISIVVGGLCGLAVGCLWKFFSGKRTTHGW